MAPKLEGWLTGAEVADILGVSRQAVNRMFSRGDFKSLHTIGDRPIYIVSAAEVRQIHEARKAKASA